jgi:hypothetical protein
MSFARSSQRPASRSRRSRSISARRFFGSTLERLAEAEPRSMRPAAWSSPAAAPEAVRDLGGASRGASSGRSGRRPAAPLARSARRGPATCRAWRRRARPPRRRATSPGRSAAASRRLRARPGRRAGPRRAPAPAPPPAPPRAVLRGRRSRWPASARRPPSHGDRRELDARPRGGCPAPRGSCPDRPRPRPKLLPCLGHCPDRPATAPGRS